ncbi:MAG: glycosyltransferase [bacterium]
MNVFIIPSWYPDSRNPIDGIFIKEQVAALAKTFPEHNFIVSHCENFYFSLTSISKSSRTFKDFLKAKTFTKKYEPNLIEYNKPAVTWTGKLRGEINNIIKAHTQHFLKARNEFGHIDIIHAHVSYTGGFSAMKLKEKFNVPYIITEHMAPFPFDNFINKEKLSDKISAPIKAADRVIAASKFQAEKIHSFGFKKPVVIPNMVNENLFYPPLTQLNNNRIKFLTVTTFIERKGIEELMESILKTLRQGFNGEFVIAGTGYLENYIKDFINKNKLSDRVLLFLNPKREAVIKLFRECDVFILPSRLDSFGIVYVEALACGKPVIATDCGGPSDFVNKENGLMVETGNIDQISEAITLMATNIHKYDPLKIRKFFMSRFSGKVVCSQIVSLYEEITRQKK